MGTDIHGVFQRRDATAGKWVDVPSKYEQDRHYQLFAVLGGVRNGYGFAGVKTGEPVAPIAERRGLPKDFEVIGHEDHPIASLEILAPWMQKMHCDGEPLIAWMGDHSHSWATGEEMTAWFAAAPTVVKTGILDRATYDKWDKRSEPESYCGGVSGRDIVIINDNAVEREQTPGWNHIRCEWESKLASELAYFFDEVARLQAEHGQIRFVFGFDS